MNAPRSTIRLVGLALLLLTSCRKKDATSSGGIGEAQDGLEASNASAQTASFADQVFSTVKSPEASAAAAEIVGPASQLWPAGCVSRTRDAACSATSCTVHVKYADCTGPRGLVHLSGDEDIVLTKTASGLRATWSSVGLTANGRPATHTATADIALTSATTRTVTWNGHFKRTRDDGVEVDHTSQLTIDVDLASRCRTADGTEVTMVGAREIHGTVEALRTCHGADGVEYCPSGTITEVHAASGRTLTLDFDGTAEMTVSTANVSVAVPLVCPAMP